MAIVTEGKVTGGVCRDGADRVVDDVPGDLAGEGAAAGEVVNKTGPV